ncbi:NAD(P)H-hydrate epimerase [Candidatus Woesearchaeota archaeon]|nr:NAD(P)H-hydrate epimerase [Candidatus Woesearchaeota archaeon]
MLNSMQIRALEAQANVPLSVLMKRAGNAVNDALRQKFDLKGKKILVVCYHGNNGGDGFVAADLLSENAEVDVLFIGDEEKMKRDATMHYKKLLNNTKVQFVNDDEVDFGEYGIIIDAILGIGYKGRMNKEITAVVDDINKSGSFKVSIDIPTGLDPDSGEVHDACVNADLIVTFHDMKPGLEKFREKVVVADLGIGKAAANAAF